jgi:hypothetical protein
MHSQGPDSGVIVMKTEIASTAPMFARPAAALTTAITVLSEATTALMTCEICDLTGGPFPAAEAAHLKAIHDRLHHGWSVAA